MDSGVPGTGGRLDAGPSTVDQPESSPRSTGSPDHSRPAGAPESSGDTPSPGPPARPGREPSHGWSPRSGAFAEPPPSGAFAEPDRAPTPPSRAVPVSPAPTGPAQRSGVASGAALNGTAGQNGAAGLTQRLRSMLPWPSTSDPINMIIRAHRGSHPGADVSVLRRAYAIAEQMHRGQSRKSGEPYITHPVAVTEILASLGMDTTTLVAALLHDTVEDTSYTLQALEGDFGQEVALLVDGVTKFDKVFYGDAAEAETIRKMIIAAGRDVRVLIVKLADRLHNMRTLDARSPASRTRIATATRDVLVPLCDRLGIQALKRELEDCVLQWLSPSGYALISDYVKHRQGWSSYLSRVIDAIGDELRRSKIDGSVFPRPRHLYSIWRDTVNGHYADPHDLPRVVVVIDGPETDCYAALGVVHGMWRPVPGRFKDFIASPKNNLYRSLHTTVVGPDDHLLEVLIRTAPMHRAAEYGIVTNFRYPHETARFGPATHAEQLAWLQQVLDWESAAADPAQFLASLRCDLAESQIIVFTSTGRPALLPAEATPVDLAYTLSADVGHRCVAAKINGRLVPLSSALVDGDSVEIITRPGQRDEFDFDDQASPSGPEKHWLDFVKTSHARLHISRWFADHEAPAVTIANKVRLGRLAIGLALRQHGRGLASDLPLVRLAGRLGFPDLETLLVAVADHKMSAATVVEQLIAAVDAVNQKPR